MSRSPTAEDFAYALLASARPQDDDVSALLDGTLTDLAPEVWRSWRCLAATGMVCAGFDADAVHRGLELTDVRAMDHPWNIPNKAASRRTELTAKAFGAEL